MKYRLKKFGFLLIFFSFYSVIYSQTELVPVKHHVYDFLKRMQVNGVIPSFNSANLPIDRDKVSGFLKKIDSLKSSITNTDRKILAEMLTEFNQKPALYDTLSYGFFNNPSIGSIFDNGRQKYLYKYNDDNVSFYVDGMASYSYRSFNGDSFDNTIMLGELGMRFRGTLYENLGFYLRLSNGQQISGGDQDRYTAMSLDQKLSSNVKFRDDKYYDSFEGYLRYSAPGDWFSILLGREQINFGFGYLDKLFISNNAIPFDMMKIDLNYKAISYSFFYGNIKGDSLGRPISSKNIVGNSLSFNFPRVKFSFYEAIIVADRPLSFTYLNPVSFLISADFSYQNDNDNNALMGLSVEVNPFNNISLQGSLLIDDLSFGSLFKSESLRDNRFGLQGGLIWNDFLTIPNFKLTTEYTRIDPYVYTHRTNKASYTHWNWSIGHHLPPNSDEIAIKGDYDISQRIHLSAEFMYQRSANGYSLTPSGTISRNNGGDLLRGDGDLLALPEFLKGNRYTKKTFSAGLYIEPVKQCFLILNYSKIITDLDYLGKSKNDNLFYLTAGVDF